MAVEMQRKVSSPLREAQMLDAALVLFARIGYRAVTMERVALEAGFSKATVYAYFSDKEDLFRRTAARLAGDILDTVESNLRRDGPASERICAALQAKDILIYELVRSSPHADELLAAKHELVRELFEDTDKRVRKAIARVVNDDSRGELSAARLARILVRASRGLAAGAESSAGLRADISVLVGRLL